MLLQGHGLRRVYAFVLGNVAVVSLPEVNVWVSPYTLNWTHHGEPGTWPAGDMSGAADHLASLAHPASLPPTGGG
jgi:hypothetical protein